MRAIRARRRTLIRSVRETVGPLEPLRDSVRRHPAAWALGGALAGLVATRSFGATLARNGRRLASTWVEHRLGDVLIDAAMKAAAVVSAELRTPPAETSKASASAAPEAVPPAARVRPTSDSQPEEQQALPGS